MKKMMILATAFLVGTLPLSATDDNPGASADKSSKGEKLMRLSKLMDAKATSRAGEDLGGIKELIIDAQQGKVTHAVLSAPGEAGKDELVPIPWRALTVQSEKQLTVNVEKARLAMAPSIDQSCAQLADPEYVVTVEHYYIVPVPVAVGEAGEDTAVGGSSDIEGSDGESGTGASSDVMKEQDDTNAGGEHPEEQVQRQYDQAEDRDQQNR